MCLQTCLEVLRVPNLSKSLDIISHQVCGCRGTCKIKCIAALEMNISLYLDELSRIFFKKENMRKKDSWWLSAFYSFCIQSFVRKSLIELDNGSDASKQYLHLPVRLFIASSGVYDPLAEDWSQMRTLSNLDSGNRDPKDYQEAQLAVSCSKWKSAGISGSAQFLKRIFEDYDARLGEPRVKSA